MAIAALATEMSNTSTPRAVALAGVAASGRTHWSPALRLLEQTTGKANRRKPVLYLHGFTFPSQLCVLWTIEGRSWADVLNEAGMSVWGLDFAGFGGSERYPSMGADTPPAGEPLGRILMPSTRRCVWPNTSSRKLGSVSYHYWPTRAARSLEASSRRAIPS